MNNATSRIDTPHETPKPIGLKLHELAQIPEKEFDPYAVMSLIDDMIGGSKKTTKVHKGPVFELTTEELKDFAKVVDLFDKTVEAKDLADLEIFESLIVEALECIELRKSLIADAESVQKQMTHRVDEQQRQIYQATYNTLPGGNPAGKARRRRLVG